MQPASRVLANGVGPLRQPAHVPVGQHPRGVLGDQPQPGRRRGLALQVAHVVEIFERAQQSGGLEREGARGKAEAADAAGRKQTGKERAQVEAHPLAIAVHRLLDAGAEGGRAGETRLARERHLHGKPDRAVDGAFRSAAGVVDDLCAHILPRRGACTRPGFGDLERAAAPDDVARRRQTGRGVGPLHSGSCCRPVARRRRAPKLAPAPSVFAEPGSLRLGEARNLNQRQAPRPSARARAAAGPGRCLRPG